MSTRVTSSEGVHAMYDSVTGRAFGPVFDSEDEANDFVKWFQEHRGDPRSFTNGVLEGAVTEWRAGRGD